MLLQVGLPFLIFISASFISASFKGTNAAIVVSSTGSYYFDGPITVVNTTASTAASTSAQAVDVVQTLNSLQQGLSQANMAITTLQAMLSNQQQQLTALQQSVGLAVGATVALTTPLQTQMTSVQSSVGLSAGSTTSLSPSLSAQVLALQNRVANSTVFKWGGFQYFSTSSVYQQAGMFVITPNIPNSQWLLTGTAQLANCNLGSLQLMWASTDGTGSATIPPYASVLFGDPEPRGVTSATLSSGNTLTYTLGEPFPIITGPAQTVYLVPYAQFSTSPCTYDSQIVALRIL